MTAPAWTSAAHPASGLRLPVPDGWEVLLDEGAALVLASPLGPGQSTRFRPNVVVTVEQPPPALADIAAYTASSLDGMARMLTGFQVIAVDDVAIGGHEGRRVLAGYRSGIYALAAEYWWTVAHRVGTTLPATCQVEDYQDLAQVFEEVADGLVPAERLPGADQ